LSDELSRSKVVICPPAGIDPGISVPPVGGGVTYSAGLRSGARAKVACLRFLITHEVVEKALLDGLHLHYLHAHQIALRIEQAAVRAAGISWRDYNRFTKAHEKKIGDERVVRVPSDLDLTTYREEHDLPELRKIIAARAVPAKGGVSSGPL
jgi:hypothetical protein